MTTVRPVVLVAVVSVALAVMRVSQSAATTIYGVSGDYNGALPSSVFAIDPDALTLTTIASPLPGVGATLAPSLTSTTELFVSIVDATFTSRLYRVTIAGGSLSSPIGSPAPIVSLGEGRDGFLYATGGGPCCFPGSGPELYRIDPTNASYTLMGAGAAGYSGDVATDAAGTLFGLLGSGDLAHVDKTTGAQTVVGSIGGGFVGLAFSLDGRLWGARSDNKLYEIDQHFATTTFVMDLPVPGGALVFDLASEPGTAMPLPTSTGPTPTRTPTPTPTPTLTPQPLDHFTCYKAGASKGSVKFPGIPGVDLTDQFGDSRVEVKKPKFLCAPTNKLGEDPSAPAHPEHLEGYQVKNAETPVLPTIFRVIDQFHPDLFFLHVKKQSHLLVPTVKSLSEPPPLPGIFEVDHFQCYKVRLSKGTAKFVPIPNVEIEDQFGIMHVDVTKPKFLCAPVDKNGEDPTAPAHPEHLVCYQVKQVKTELKFPKVTGVFVNNQFGPEQLDVKKPSELCVPALRELP